MRVVWILAVSGLGGGMAFADGGAPIDCKTIMGGRTCDQVPKGSYPECCTLPAAPSKVYIYKIKIHGAKASSFSGMGATVAKSLNAGPYKDDCVDLRSTGMALHNDMIESETIQVVMNKEISAVELDNMRKDLCEGAPPFMPRDTDQDPKVPNHCGADFSAESYPITSLSISASPLTKRPVEFGEKGPPSIDKPIPAGTSRLPRFSEACKTGRQEDSNAASTPEARELIKNLGIDITRTRFLSLKKNGAGDTDRLFDFGFPRAQVGDASGSSSTESSSSNF